jgi:predicted HTH transcriptional regulator
MNQQEFKELLERGREQRAVEFKRAGSRKDKLLLARVIRAVIGMANRRDGGLVIIGVDEDDNKRPVPSGISDEDLSTWTHDDFADASATYADPNVSFDLETVDCEGKKFIVIHVEEFEDFPVICKRDFPDVLRSGACYVRPRRKPETVEIPTHTDMRDLLELAAEKGVRRFIKQAHGAGLGLTAETISSDAELFDKQLGDLIGEKSE